MRVARRLGLVVRQQVDLGWGKYPMLRRHIIEQLTVHRVGVVQLVFIVCRAWRTGDPAGDDESRDGTGLDWANSKGGTTCNSIDVDFQSPLRKGRYWKLNRQTNSCGKPFVLQDSSISLRHAGMWRLELHGSGVGKKK